MNSMPSPATLIPHAGKAVLLDEIRAVSGHRLVASLRVRPDTSFSDASGNLPAWVGPEIMAQAIAAISGHRSRLRDGRAAAVGLLLGVRQYETVVSEFRPGEELSVEVIESSADEEGRGVFDCTILRSQEVLAVGTLTVFQPEDNSWFEREFKARG